MNVLIHTIPWHEERYRWAQDLAAEVERDHAVAYLVEDRAHSCVDTFMLALDRQIELGGGAWHLEDDVELTSRWAFKARWVSQEKGRAIIQGFSRLKDDAAKGSRWTRHQYYYNTCVWLPESVAKPLREHFGVWYAENRDKETGGSDTAINEFLRANGLRYWLAVPSLVQHRAVPSSIGGAGRTPNRQSPTFVP